MATGLDEAFDESPTMPNALAASSYTNRFEVLCGSLVVTPAPDRFHLAVASTLQRQLEDYFERRYRGVVFHAPIDVILGEHDVVQPDLFVVEDPRQISQRGIEGVPLVVVEVVSSLTAEVVRGVKRHRYALAGVEHYWIIDPEARRVDCYRLHKGSYQLVVQATDGVIDAHPDWPGLQIRAAELWERTQPSS